VNKTRFSRFGNITGNLLRFDQHGEAVIWLVRDRNKLSSTYGAVSECLAEAVSDTVTGADSMADVDHRSAVSSCMVLKG
jgi:hypothetical protein